MNRKGRDGKRRQKGLGYMIVGFNFGRQQA